MQPVMTNLNESDTDALQGLLQFEVSLERLPPMTRAL